VQHNEYDLAEAFQRIENELMASMIRNMDRHRAEETKEGYNWSMWQTEQLKALERYKQKNQKKYQKQFKSINAQIEQLIRQARAKGSMKQEIKILQAIKKGWKTSGRNRSPAHDAMTAEFFKLNDRKLNALIEATAHDMEAAETAVFRKANDDYRKAIFDAQVYANSGAGTYEKAVDMATKDMLSRGLNCIEYANGARHTLSDYADMAIRTASKRAYLQGEGEKRQEWGIATVIMAKRGNPCPKCLPFVGKVLIDDVWSGGSKDGVDPETGKHYPLMSYAISKGLYHPRCKDSHTTYFPGISTADDSWTKEELEAIGQQSKDEAKEQYAARQEEKYGRLAKYSLDNDNKKMYGQKMDFWKHARFKTGGTDAREYADAKRPLANFKAASPEKNEELLCNDAVQWIADLSSKEIHAIKKYTYNSGDKKPNRFFERLNAMLRGDISEDRGLVEYANTISAALKSNELKHDIICYRNMEFNPYEKYAVGDIFIDKQFVSTSISPKAALNKPFKMIFLVPKGSKGAYIAKISHYHKQKEFLLDKDCKMRILSKQKDSIVVEVIP
jgi:hypothetical protein